jgi:Carboxypeptidase regulatory-like domain
VLAPAASSQVLYGSLTGNVQDGTGASVPGAKVEALNTATGILKQATTDDRGVYLFNDLQPGAYSITISAPSFSTVVEKGVPIDANTIRRLDARLQVTQINESVTVAASAVLLQSDRADINSQLQQSATYNALQTQLTRRMSSGSLVGASYTFSKSINYADNSDSGLTWNWVPMWGRNKALAGFDRTHNFQLYGNYELPFGRGKMWAQHGFANAVAGGC